MHGALALLAAGPRRPGATATSRRKRPATQHRPQRTCKRGSLVPPRAGEDPLPPPSESSTPRRAVARLVRATPFVPQCWPANVPPTGCRPVCFQVKKHAQRLRAATTPSLYAALQARDESFVGIVVISLIWGADRILKAFGVNDLTSKAARNISETGTYGANSSFTSSSSSSTTRFGGDTSGFTSSGGSMSRPGAGISSFPINGDSTTSAGGAASSLASSGDGTTGTVDLTSSSALGDASRTTSTNIETSRTLGTGGVTSNFTSSGSSSVNAGASNANSQGVLRFHASDTSHGCTLPHPVRTTPALL